MSHPVNPGNYSESGDYPPATSDPATGAGYTDASYTETASGYAEPVAGYSETAETGYGSSAYVAPSGGSYAAGSTSSSSSGISDVSVGEIMGKISADMSTLMRQELQLAKAELTVEAKKATAGVAMLAAAGVAGFFLLMFALITLWQALASLFDEDAWSALVVTVLLAVVAGVLALMGKKKMQQVNPKPEQTIETLQEAPSALKPSNR